MKNFRKNLQFILGAMLIVAIVLGISIFARPKASGDLQIYFLNVGQGDAEYIKTPVGQDILIDGGPDNSVLNELGKVMDFGDREINLVILSHPHADHLTGLLEVLRRYKIDEVWQTGIEYPSSTYESFQKEIAQKNIASRIVQKGDTKDFGEVKITVLYPLSPLAGKTIDNLNNASQVDRLDYKKFSVLFPGDAEKEIQSKILDKNIFATVLKVAHHGSGSGLSEDFLKVVRPAIAIIEVGRDNKYGHPAQNTINLLKNYAVRIFRTDQNGTIEIDSDGQGYSVKTDI